MEFKIQLSAEELRLAADCASMVQNHVTLVSMTQTGNGIDEELENLLDCFESAVDPGGGQYALSAREPIRAAWKRLKGNNHWLDAPTCEGWWWKKTQYNLEVLFIQMHDGELHALIHGEHWPLSTEKHPGVGGRWFGPLVPPSVVSGATSSGA